MFAFFISGGFYGFWSNKPGDVFVAATARALGWDLQALTLLYFPITQAPKVFRFNDELDLVIQKQNFPEAEGEEGEPAEPFLEDIEVIQGEFYYRNGGQIKTC